MATRRHFIRLSSVSAIGLLLSSFNKGELLAVSESNYNIILGRPTKNSIIVSLMMKSDTVTYIEYGTNQDKLNQTTAKISVVKYQPNAFKINGLATNQKYYYRICHQTSADALIKKEEINNFRTQRNKGDEFIFTIAADSHLGTLKHCDPLLYQTTLNNIAKDEPDLHFALGDDFRASRVRNPDYQKIEELYLTQREHLGTLHKNIPYFFILGNHEMEAKAFDNGTENCLAAWSEKARKKFVPNPINDSFYTGNELEKQNYYAFEWGDVHFITLDVFCYSNVSAEDEEMREQHKAEAENMSKEQRIKLKEQANKNGSTTPKKDQWAFTLGDEQYNWLRRTLTESKAKYKFVMGHHVMGSTRGGVEWATMFEWGGKSRKGINEFKQKRPNWEMPIHDLFVKYKVDAFFQGHDHLFARQELDGVAYITCPMCGDPGYNTYNADGFLSGDKLSNTGHLRIVVNNKDVQMQYIKAVLPKDEANQVKNGTLAYAYSFIQKKVLPIT